MRWESARKKRVMLRIGYVGTDYRGFARRLFNFPREMGGMELFFFTGGMEL